MHISSETKPAGRGFLVTLDVAIDQGKVLSLGRSHG